MFRHCSGQKEHGGYLDDVKAGVRYVTAHRAISTLFIFFALVWFLVVPAAFLSPLLVARSYGEEVWRLTANEVTFFGGSILGGIVMTAWGGFKNKFRTIGLTCIAWGTASAPIISLKVCSAIGIGDHGVSVNLLAVFEHDAGDLTVAHEDSSHRAVEQQLACLPV